MANIYETQNFLTMSRSKMDVKTSHKTSVPFGKMVPIGGTPLDVLPGSTIKLDLANITRMLTPVAPIMDDISMDVYSFYVPWRLVFDKTKQFFGENDQVAWTLNTSEELPHIILGGLTSIDALMTAAEADFDNPTTAYLYLVDDVVNPTKILKSAFAGSLFDYFGLPFVYPNLDLLSKIKSVLSSGEDELISIQAAPFRAVQLIYNEFFRNENVTDPILDLLYDNQDFPIDLGEWILDMKTGNNDYGYSRQFWMLPSVARWKDLFTSVLPAPQRGPAVSLPFSRDNLDVRLKETAGVPNNPVLTRPVSGVWTPYTAGTIGLAQNVDGVAYMGQISSGSPQLGYIDPRGSLEVSLENVTMATVNQIRYAFATQRYYEKLARGGARYHEYLKVMFGVRPSDATLQRPQFLGGHHQSINVQQVLQTSETNDTPLGSTGAYSVTGFKAHTFTNSFNEFGIILSFAAIRKQHTYCQGLDKYWTKRDVFDIYNPTFAHIGEVPVAKNEVYWQPGNTDVLGYNEAWYEYRSISSKVTGLLNPLAPNNLSSFVLTDVYESAPVLDDAFIFEDPQGLDRALVAGANATDQFICDFYFHYTISAVMPVHSTPGLIDHY